MAMVATAAKVMMTCVSSDWIPLREFAFLVQSLPDGRLYLAIDAGQSRFTLLVCRCWAHRYDASRAKVSEFQLLARPAGSVQSAL